MQTNYLTRSGVSFPATAAPRSRWAFSVWLLLCLMARSVVVSGQTIPSFGGTAEVPVGSTPYSVAAADVDRDGDLDILAANFDGNTVSVRLNNGSGVFSGAAEVPVGTGPYCVVTTDVNRDGDPDLLTANFASNSVSVRFNNGSGTFSGNTNVPVGTNPISIAAADVDGDGDLDLLVANYDGNSVSVRLNNGSGVFSGNTNVPVGTGPYSVAAADVDRDGDPDMLVANYFSNTVSVRLNNGSGAFSGGTEVSAGDDPISIAAADVDGDGDPDLLAANYFNSTVSVRLNNGSGVFGGNTSVGVGASPYQVVAADVDGDGDPDLLTANAGSSNVSVRLNNGSGVFGGTTNVAVGANPYGVAAADVDGDGDLDILAANGTSNSVSVRLNQAVSTATTTSLAAVTTTYGNTSVNLIAAVSPVPTGGSVAFFLKDYPATGTNTAIGTASRGADDTFTLSYNPSTLNARGYTVIAKYGGSAPFTASEGNGPLTVNRKAASVTPHALSKVYGDADPQLTGTLEGFLARDGVTATYSRTAGETVNRGPYTISATLSPAAVLGNYNISYKTADFTITPRPLTITATAQNKVYDGNTAAQVTLTDNRVPNDQISVLFISATFADKNAGTGKTVTVNGLSVMGLPGNYSLAGPAVTATADITPKPITGSFTAAGKTYDGTDVATVVNSGLNGVVGNDQVLLTGGTAKFPSKNVGSARPVTLTGATLSGAQAGNYSLGSVAPTLATISPKELLPTVTVENKVYDGTETATIKTRSLSGVVQGDAVELVGGAAFFENRNVGNDKLVQAATFSLSGADAGNYNIYLPTVTTRANITPKAVTGSFTAFNKMYDGNTSAQVEGYGSPLQGVVYGDHVSLTGGTATFDNKNVGNGKTVTLTGATLTGSQAGNYSLGSVAPTTANITPRFLVPAIKAADKVYDGTTTATLTSRTVSGLVAGETGVELVAGSANFSYKDVGTNILVEAFGLSLAGADASNYTLLNAYAGTSAAITQRPLTAASTVASKVYDGTVTPGAVTVGAVSGLVGTETLVITATASDYADAGIGTSKATTITYTLANGANGGRAANYSMAPLATTGQIMAREITGSFTAASKTYDGNATATVTGRFLSGIAGSDQVSLSGGTAAFADKNAGNGKTVTLTGATLAGAQAGNYTLTSVATTTADIAWKALTAASTVASRVYDGTVTPGAVTVGAVSGLVGSETLNITATAGNYADINVGTKATTISYVLANGADGGLAANYSMAPLATTGQITVRPVTVTADARTKVYGDADPALTYRITSGSLANGDVFTGAITRMAGEAAGTYDMALGSLSISRLGVNVAGNYARTFISAKLTITARPITIKANDRSKVYGDALTLGTTAFTVSAGNLVYGNTITGVTLTSAGAAASATVTTPGPTYPVEPSAAVGTGLSNYLITYANGTLTVTPKPITVTANSRIKTYGETITFAGNEFSVPAGALVNGNTITGVILTSAGAAGGATVTAPGPVYAIVPGNAAGTGLGNYNISYANGTLTVNPAEASLVYSGLEYFATPTATSSTAKVEYIATVTDGRTNSGGDVSTTRLLFSDGSNNATRDVVLFDGANKRVGSARTGIDALTVGLSGSELKAGGKTLDLNVSIPAGSNYTGALPQRTIITIAVPGKDFVNGGGNLLMSNSAGTYAATAGSKINFGFTMKWNSSGRNIQGQANIIFRSNGKVYQIKSNAINTLGTSTVSGGRRADFNTKANLTDVTNPLAPIPMGGNLDLSVQAFESTVTGGKHQISVTLRNGTKLWFSSSWDGAKSVMRDLTGGAIRVRNTNTPSANGRQGSGTAARTAETSTAFTVNAYPNPFAEKFYLSIGSEVTGDVALTVVDGKGRTVTRQVAKAAAQGSRTVEIDLAGEPHGVYLLHVQSGAKREVIKVFKMNR